MTTFDFKKVNRMLSERNKKRVMKKREWIEQHEEDLKRYDKSILSHNDDEHDSMKDYEFSVMHHDDESQYGGGDWYEPMGHFRD